MVNESRLGPPAVVTAVTRTALLPVPAPRLRLVWTVLQVDHDPVGWKYILSTLTPLIVMSQGRSTVLPFAYRKMNVRVPVWLTENWV